MIVDFFNGLESLYVDSIETTGVKTDLERSTAQIFVRVLCTLVF